MERALERGYKFLLEADSTRVYLRAKAAEQAERQAQARSVLDAKTQTQRLVQESEQVSKLLSHLARSPK